MIKAEVKRVNGRLEADVEAQGTATELAIELAMIVISIAEKVEPMDGFDPIDARLNFINGVFAVARRLFLSKGGASK